MSLMSSYTPAKPACRPTADSRDRRQHRQRQHHRFKGSRAAFEDALTQTVMNGQLGTGTHCSRSSGCSSRARSPHRHRHRLALDARLLRAQGRARRRRRHLADARPAVHRRHDGYLVNQEGLRVQGYPADATGVVQPGVDDLLIGNASSPPKATTSLTLKGNLSADAVCRPLDPANPTPPRTSSRPRPSTTRSANRTS